MSKKIDKRTKRKVTKDRVCVTIDKKLRRASLKINSNSLSEVINDALIYYLGMIGAIK